MIETGEGGAVVCAGAVSIDSKSALRAPVSRNQNGRILYH